MSLEQAITENTAAIRDLIEHLRTGFTGVTGVTVVKPTVTLTEVGTSTGFTVVKPTVRLAKVETSTGVSVEEKDAVAKVAAKPLVKVEPKADAPAEKPAASTATPAASAPTAGAATDAAPAEKAPSYDEVSRAITDLATTKGRAAAVELLGKFGATTGKDLQKTPERYVDFIAQARALVAG